MGVLIVSEQGNGEPSYQRCGSFDRTEKDAFSKFIALVMERWQKQPWGCTFTHYAPTSRPKSPMWLASTASASMRLTNCLGHVFC